MAKVHCECGELHHDVACEWEGGETVVVEAMPVYLRSSHNAAGNRGTWPANGSVRLRVSVECADRMVEAEDGWARLVS